VLHHVSSHAGIAPETKSGGPSSNKLHIVEQERRSNLCACPKPWLMMRCRRIPASRLTCHSHHQNFCRKCCVPKQAHVPVFPPTIGIEDVVQNILACGEFKANSGGAIFELAVKSVSGEIGLHIVVCTSSSWCSGGYRWPSSVHRHVGVQAAIVGRLLSQANIHQDFSA
jgi:hypothetical protein